MCRLDLQQRSGPAEHGAGPGTRCRGRSGARGGGPRAPPTRGPCTLWQRTGGWGCIRRDGASETAPEALDRRLEEVAEAVGGGYCRLQMPLKLALGVRGTVAGHWKGALKGGGGVPPPLPTHPGGGGLHPRNPAIILQQRMLHRPPQAIPGARPAPTCIVRGLRPCGIGLPLALARDCGRAVRGTCAGGALRQAGAVGGLVRIEQRTATPCPDTLTSAVPPAPPPPAVPTTEGGIPMSLRRCIPGEKGEIWDGGIWCAEP